MGGFKEVIRGVQNGQIENALTSLEAALTSLHGSGELGTIKFEVKITVTADLSEAIAKVESIRSMVSQLRESGLLNWVNMLGALGGAK